MAKHQGSGPEVSLQPESSSVTQGNSIILSSTTPNLTSSSVSLIMSSLRRPSRGLITIHSENLYLWIPAHSAAIKNEVKYYPQTWPLSAYNDLFVSISCLQAIAALYVLLWFHHNSLTQPTYICLPCLSFLNISHATSFILINCSTLISLVFVPCPLSLPI